MNCQHCGEIMFGKNRKYCDKVCRGKHHHASYKRTNRTRYVRSCVRCGKSFKATSKHARFCSQRCKALEQFKDAPCNKTYLCQTCGNQFKPKNSQRAFLYCSRECGFERLSRYRVPMADGILEWLTSWKRCKKCGEWYSRRIASGELCYACALGIVGECRFCGVKYKRSQSYQHFCSDGCVLLSKKESYRRKHKREKVLGTRSGCHRRRARRYGVAYEPIRRRDVFVRDKYICHLCHKKTRKPTIDHIVPMSRGGGHVWNNVACACLACNCRKSGRIIGQLRLC